MHAGALAVLKQSSSMLQRHFRGLTSRQLSGTRVICVVMTEEEEEEEEEFIQNRACARRDS
jgi:hypothetical protein